MIFIKSELESFWNDMGEIIRLFYPNESLERLEDESNVASDDLVIIHQHRETESYWENKITIMQGNEVAATRCFHSPISGKGNALHYKKYLKRSLKMSFYCTLKSFTGKRIPWGALTGIRPTKIVHEMIREGLTEKEVETSLYEQFDVDIEKSRLLIQTVQNQKRILTDCSPKDLNLYIGIPFCRSRCLYCSFPSYSIDSCKGLIEPYLKALYQEMDRMLERAYDKGYHIRNVYIGGGTPTSIPSDSLARLLEKLGSLIPGLPHLEFTVEAGRPDCLDAQKLQILRKYGVNRISINPQTMNDETLKRIGRFHSSQETIDIFHLARSYGFPVINMDIIIGLPGESPAMVEHTLDEIEKLRPENLTVHTLAIKRASRLKNQLEQYVLPNQEEAEQMLMISQEWAAHMGMVPYYLYRQKYMMGNLENIGYCYPGKECAYNIQIMEESCSILALGAGAITKWLYPQENRLERFPNVKNIEDYIHRIDEMIYKKLEVI